MIAELTATQAITRLRAMDRARKNGILYEYLRWKYGNEPLLERSGITFPVACYRASPQQRNDPESALAHPLNPLYPPNGQLVRDTVMRALIECAGRPATNRANVPT